MIKSTDLAYAAGYIDGDGCFHIGKIHSENREKFRCMFVINTTEIENVQWFHRIFGGTIITKHVNPNHKPLHRFTLKGQFLENFEGIGGYLVEKIGEFKIFEDFRRSTRKEDKEEFICSMKTTKKTFNLIPKSIKEHVESLRNTVNPTIEDFAYLAGFIDAECCLGIQKSKPKNRPNHTYKIQLQCNNSKSPCFIWLSKRFGGQFHFIDRSKFGTPHRNQMTWRLSAAALYPILENILPFLKHKKPVCEELINFYKTTITKGHISPNSPQWEEYYRPILELREQMFHRIKQLNKKGI